MRYIPILLVFILITSGCSSMKNSEYQVFSQPEEKATYAKAYDQVLTLWDTEYVQQDVQTNYGKAHVVISGPAMGEPVVLFHGMDASNTMWYPNVKALSKNYRVYAIDFPLEAGKSVSCSQHLNEKQVISYYNEIFDHYKLNHISLIGASRGGWMATNIALYSGTRIKKLVLLSPAQTLGSMKSPLKVLSAVKLKLFPNKKRLAKFFDTFSTHPERIDASYKDQFYLANLYGDSKPQYIEMKQFSEKKLRTLGIPVLILVGDHDIVNDEEALTKARRVLPVVETAMIKDAGHFLSIDQSAIVNQKMLDFLNTDKNVNSELSAF